MADSLGSSAVCQAAPAALSQKLQSGHRIDNFSAEKKIKTGLTQLFLIIVHLPFISSFNRCEDLHFTLTGLHSSSVKMTPSSSARHSRASKYNHCMMGMNFPVHAYGTKLIVKRVKQGIWQFKKMKWALTKYCRTHLTFCTYISEHETTSYCGKELTFITSCAARPPMKALTGARSPAAIYDSFLIRASSSCSSLADPVWAEFSSLANVSSSSPSA